jgi:hypothetical protein
VIISAKSRASFCPRFDSLLSSLPMWQCSYGGFFSLSEKKRKQNITLVGQSQLVNPKNA